ncbi:hypothetical protein LAZ40_09135 [Cereibacter sphaeroides]|uniref:hypothetical protein n=1 Tax=Cereibacter sphaeroides TaxID=1063 RepID=UPI001F208610|nr:hypothetical protein [Cereibacter sphaeroides]MCE6959214.1 hypothetical protein [Cereibacter sphaeroides]MCE6972017.1 hypothetical protein [Cereibacter sphaeroides]
MALPEHGPIDCRLCWEGCPDRIRGFGGKDPGGNDWFRLVRDPAACGSTEPLILVLGMSKG